MTTSSSILEDLKLRQARQQCAIINKIEAALMWTCAMTLWFGIGAMVGGILYICLN